MKNISFLFGIILILLVSSKPNAKAEELLRLNFNLAQTKVDTVLNVPDSTRNENDTLLEDNEDYETSDLLNLIVDPLLKRFTNRRERRELTTLYREKPYISLYGGQLEMENESIQYDFEKSADIQLLLGYSTRRQYPRSILILTTNRFLSVKNLSNNWIDLSEVDAPISARTWNFGFNRSKDYGWNFDKNFKINLTHSEGLHWSFMNFNITGLDPTDTLNYPSKLIAISDKAKFGEGFSAGIEIELFNHFGITGGYERMDVFPAHIFWEWAASGILEEIAQGLVDNFVSRVRKFSPWATPIISFALKNGLSYGLYELRRKNMNWPFNSAPPYIFETFKVGVIYKF